MNYTKTRNITQLNKENKLLSEAHGELTSKCAALEGEVQKLKDLGGTDSEVAEKLKKSETNNSELSELLQVSDDENKSLKDEVESMKKQILDLNEKLKKKIDQGPNNKNSGPNRGGKGGSKL